MEEKRKLAVARLELERRIDRMDRLAAGGHALIDTGGRPTPNEWIGERPDDPQLPLYALNARKTSPSAFARLKTGEMRYMGFSEGRTSFPSEAGEGLAALVEGWEKELDALDRLRFG